MDFILAFFYNGPRESCAIVFQVFCFLRTVLVGCHGSVSFFFFQIRNIKVNSTPKGLNTLNFKYIGMFGGR